MDEQTILRVLKLNDWNPEAAVKPLLAIQVFKLEMIAIKLFKFMLCYECSVTFESIVSCNFVVYLDWTLSTGTSSNKSQKGSYRCFKERSSWQCKVHKALPFYVCLIQRACDKSSRKYRKRTDARKFDETNREISARCGPKCSSALIDLIEIKYFQVI